MFKSTITTCPWRINTNLLAEKIELGYIVILGQVTSNKNGGFRLQCFDLTSLQRQFNLNLQFCSCILSPVHKSQFFMTDPVDISGTVVGESPDCLLLSGTVDGENPDHVCRGARQLCHLASYFLLDTHYLGHA